jgi:hypothetical protein
MSFRAVLKIEDKSFSLLTLMSTMWQKTDAKGRPVSQVRAGGFEFFLRGSDDDFMPSWASDKKKTHDGTITIYEWDQDVKVRETSFKKAYLLEFCESFITDFDEDYLRDMHVYGKEEDETFAVIKNSHKEFSTNYIFYVKISAEEVEVDGVKHTNHW